MTSLNKIHGVATEKKKKYRLLYISLELKTVLLVWIEGEGEIVERSRVELTKSKLILG